MSQKDNYYVLYDENAPYTYNRHVSIDISYINTNKSFSRTEWITEFFSEYVKITEPMIFNSELREIFTNILVAPQPRQRYMTYNRIFDSLSFLKEYKKPDGYFVSSKFKPEKYKKADHFLASKNIYPYPFIQEYDMDYSPRKSYMEISGTHLKELLIQISDNPFARTTENLTFNRHTRALKELFKKACIESTLPFQTIEEYYSYMYRQQQLEKQEKNRIQQRIQQDDEQAKLLLNRYKK